MRILPSIASANPLCYGEEIRRLGNVGYLHLDIEDGNFIPNITFGLKTIRAIASASRAALDVHLMTSCPGDYLDGLCQAGVQSICFHIESESYPLRLLNKIKCLGMKAGLAINMKTSLEELRMFLKEMDYLLIMTAEEDSEGQCFREESFDRISQAREMLSDHGELWVDGGICPYHLPRLCRCGVDRAVMGRAVFGEENPQEAIRQWERTAKKG